MKKIIAVILALTVITVGVIWYRQTHYVGYVYTDSGINYDDGICRGTRWVMTGEEKIYSYNQLKELGKSHEVKISGLMGGPKCLVFVLTEDTILVIPGLSFDSGIAKTYGLF